MISNILNSKYLVVAHINDDDDRSFINYDRDDTDLIDPNLCISFDLDKYHFLNYKKLYS